MMCCVVAVTRAQENCRKPELTGQTTHLEFSSNSCALQRRLHDAKAGGPAPYGSTGYDDRFVYKPHSCSVDNRNLCIAAVHYIAASSRRLAPNDAPAV